MTSVPYSDSPRVATAYLALGGNLGDRAATLGAALRALHAPPELAVVRVSRAYETAPVGPVEQPDFLNAVAEVCTTLTPEALLARCLAVEARLGRVRTVRWGPRTIDLDLLWFAGATRDTADLRLPHPRLWERAFVLAPLAELAPGLRGPDGDVAALAARLGGAGVRAVGELAWRPVDDPRRTRHVFAERHDPLALFDRFAGRRGAFFLDSALPAGGLGRTSYLGCEPFLVATVRDGAVRCAWDDGRSETLRGDPLATLRELWRECGGETAGDLAAPADEPTPEFGFAGGAVGWFGYEFGAAFERVRSRHADELGLPDAVLSFHAAVLACDPVDGRTRILGVGADPARTDAAVRRLRALVDEPPPPRDATAGGTGEPVANVTRAEHEAAVERVRAYIATGDVYQVNLSQRFAAPLPCAPAELYRRLRARSPAPFGCYFDGGDHQIAGVSPERFLRVDGDRVSTRPIKGTRPRGRDAAEDAALRDELRASAKDAAELLMIVDLERNDLGRVCVPGSVVVDELRVLEPHPTVWHQVAQVSGRLRPGVDFFELLRATFPGGSITGAPKVRAMQVIDELERCRRGAYTGACGWLGFDGRADWNIAIRTVQCASGAAHYHVGGGIVWDSVPAAEYEETLAKGRALYEALRRG